MGILGGILNGLLDVGLNQLNGWISREIEEGRLENALRAAQSAEADLVNLSQYQQNVAEPLMQGRGVLPGGHALTGGAAVPSISVDPLSSGAIEALNYARQLPQVHPKIFSNPYTAQRYIARASQFIDNDPLILQREAAQKAAEERMGLVKTMTGDMFKQGDVGFQEGLGAFDNPRGFDLSRQDRITRKGELEAGKTTAREQAQEPFRDKSLQRSLQLKQTPGARATGGGGGGPEGGSVNTLSPALSNTIENRFKKYSRYRTEVDKNVMGNPIYELNPRGQRVREIAEEMYSGTKKPNWGAIERKAMAQEQKEFSEDSIQSADRAWNQNFGNTKPDAPTPQKQAQKVSPPAGDTKMKAMQLTEQDRQDIERMRTELKMTDEEISIVLRKAGKQDPVTAQKISALKARGVPDDKIRQALKADGLNPSMYGY